MRHALSHEEPHSFATLAEAGLAHNQYLLYGDTNHSKHAIRAFLSREDTVSTLAENGVKHIFLELPARLNALKNRYITGEITREELVATTDSVFSPIVEGVDSHAMIEEAVNLIDRAQPHGIAVHFIDQGFGSDLSDITDLLKEPGLEDLQEKIQTVSKQATPGKDNALFRKALSEAISPDEKQRLCAAFFSRRFNDTRTANAITQIAGPDKSLVVYGAGHMRQHSKTGMDEILDARGGATVMEVFSDRAELARREKWIKEDIKCTGNPAQDPNFIYIISDNAGFAIAPQHTTADNFARRVLQTPSWWPGREPQ